MKEKELLIRSGAAEFLSFTAESGADSDEVLYADENVWGTQDMIASLYGIDRSGVTRHLKNIFQEGELAEGAVCAKHARTAADANKEHMGLSSWRKAPDGKIMKSDVGIAKNYLTLSELDELNRIVTLYLDYAELQARRRIPMTMEDWADRLNAFLQFNERDILEDPGKVSAEVAKAFAESEFEKYRVTQDRLYKSDFDKLIEDADKT